MRSTLTAALAAGLLLAGCGATASTPAPVESESASGAVAGTVADCKEGPPAELFKAKTYSHDGVVGTMRNTGTRDLVVALATEWPGTPEDPKTPRCYLAPGKGVVFALGGGATYREVTGRFVVYDREWYDLPADSPEKSRHSRNGTAIALSDPLMGRVEVNVGGYDVKGRTAFCPVEEDTRHFLEGFEYPFMDGGARFKRLKDDKAAAREWTGINAGNVDDWARVDIQIARTGGCD
jgi:hypothetical protein